MATVLQCRGGKKSKMPGVKSILPQPNFLLCMNAPPRSGKTTVLANFIRNENWGYKWDSVVIISPTAMHDDTLKNVLTDDMRVVTDLSLMAKTLEECMRTQETEDPGHMLIIVDDAVGFMGRALEKLASRYRHYNISLIVSSQQFRMIPSVVRVCAGYWILFNTWNSKERVKMDEEFSGQFKNFMAAFEHATEREYSFLYIDVSEGLLYRKFDAILNKT